MRDAALALVLACVVVVPTIFSIAIVDSFAGPKLVALSILLPCSGAAFLAAVMARRGPRGEHARGIGRHVVAGCVLTFVLVNSLSFLAAGPDLQGFLGERFQYQGLWTLSLYAAAWYLGNRLFIERDESWRRLTTMIALSTSVVAVYADLQLLGIDPIWGGLWNLRATSTIGQANALASYLVMGIPFLAAFIRLDRRPRLRIGASIGIVASVVALIASGSRGGFLGAGVALVAWLGLHRPSIGLIRRRLPIALATMGAIAVLLTASNPLQQVARNSWDRSIAAANPWSDPSARAHLELWHVGAVIAMENPVLGIGPERFPQEFPDYAARVLPAIRSDHYARYRVESPHNVFIATAAAGGVLAFVAYVGVILCGVVGLARRRAHSRDEVSTAFLFATLVGVIAHLVTDMFMTADISSSWLFWLMLGIGAAGLRVPERASRGIPEGAARGLPPGRGSPYTPLALGPRDC